MTKTNAVLTGVCVVLAGTVAVLAANLIKKKKYIDITEACCRGDINLNDFFDDEEE